MENRPVVVKAAIAGDGCEVELKKLASNRGVTGDMAADAIAIYVGTYITSQTERRAPEDRGMRSVRYSLNVRRNHQSFQFTYGGNAKWRAGCKILASLLLIHDEPIAERVGKKLVFHYLKDHVRSRFGRRWPHRLAPWMFACYDHPKECQVFGATLAPGIPWRARLIAVGRFMDRLRGVGLSGPIQGPPPWQGSS